jgi:hypothetical protein
MNGWNALEERMRAMHKTISSELVESDDKDIVESIFFVTAKESIAKALGSEPNDAMAGSAKTSGFEPSDAMADSAKAFGSTELHMECPWI